jgi:hypothetical protein
MDNMMNVAISTQLTQATSVSTPALNVHWTWLAMR